MAHLETDPLVTSSDAPCDTATPMEAGEYEDSDILDQDDISGILRETRGDDKDKVFYPVCIGDVLDNERYRVKRKLGRGGLSTVWLAYDNTERKDVALKISILGEGAAELRMQDEIIRSVQDTSNFVIYLSSFTLHGPPDSNQKHLVLVFPVRGPSIRSSLDERSMHSRMCAAKQLLKALECLHNGGIVHLDLTDANVLWGIGNERLDDDPIDGNRDYTGPPKTIATPNQHSPDTVYLADFGLAIQAGTSVQDKLQCPTEYCAPERFHNVDPSFASDMWSYMCLFTLLYFGFNPMRDIPHMVTVLGPLPEKWKDSYTELDRDDSWYDPNGKPTPRRTLAAMMERARPEIGPEERLHALSIMVRGFSYYPEHRITAAELLKYSSFNALMEIYNC